jgi:uncharacterized protein
MDASRQLAVVTGASSGIGLELARLCAGKDFDLVIAADEPDIHHAADELRATGADVTAVEADLATIEGVDELLEAVEATGRPVDALFANAGRGLGDAFLDQDIARICQVIDTNITGTIYLVHRVGNDMRARNAGKILLTGSIAGFIPGSFQAVYNGTKAFINSFAFALRNELKDTEITVTCLMPGATDTRIFERADMLDTVLALGPKDDPAEVAKIGFEALMRGDADIVSGAKNKLQAAFANVTPAGILAELHRKMAKPGSGER